MEIMDEIDLKKVFRGKTTLFFVLAVLMVVISIFLHLKFQHDKNDHKAIHQNVQDVLLQKENETNRLMDKILSPGTNQTYPALDSMVNHELGKDPTVTIFLTSNDSLVFWSDNYIPFQDIWTEKEFNGDFIRLQDGWYLIRSKRAGPVQVTGIILVKKEYPYQNVYLENVFPDDFKTDPNIQVIPGEGPFTVNNIDGKPLFSLQFPDKIPSDDIQSLLLFALLISAFLFLVASIYIAYSRIAFFQHRNLLLLLAFAFDAVVLRMICRIWELPGFLYETRLFSPYYFATSWLEPSLGDLVTNRIVLLVIAFVFYLQYKFKYRKLRNLPRYTIHLLQVAVAVLFYFILFASFRNLVEDSSLSMNLNDISQIDRYSLMSYISLTATILSYFLVSAALLKNIWNNTLRKAEYLQTVLLVALVVAVVASFQSFISCRWPVCLILMIYLASFYYFLDKRDTIYQLPAMVLFMILFAVSSTFMLNHFNSIKEKESRKFIASNLSSKRDPLLEYEFSKTEKRILQDTIVLNYFRAPVVLPEEEQEILRYIDDTYFNAFWNKYEMLITACDRQEVLDIQPGNYLVPCYDYFTGRIGQFGVKTIDENLYYIDNQTENNNYLAVLKPQDESVTSAVRRIYVELFYKFVTETGLGYPELLIDKEIEIDNQIQDYSYARYYQGRLTYQYGDYFYRMDFPPSALQDHPAYFMEMDDYNHYVLRVDADNWLVISRKNPTFFDIVAPFSYLFLIFSLFLLAFILILYLGGAYQKFEMSFRNRFQVAIISIIFISLIVLGLITRAYIIDLNNKKNIGYLTEKTYSVLIELEHKLGDSEGIPPEMESYISELLYKFARVFFSDINLYTVKGGLIASSRPEIFEEYLLSTKMNPRAYRQLAFEGSLLYIQQEQIGKQEYLSAYIPFRNNNDQTIAYLNLPYFARQDEMREEVADFISAYINIYVLLIVLAILITILVSRYVTQPLKLIREKLRSLSYSHSSEKIEWKRDDEIGELVAEYNRALDELARSAELLARSERESAWREMAKQVAHEIKNPLTPMKLSVQYLKKAWDDQAPGWEERLNRFTATIIEQIDSLSRIATEFSDFAKMPLATFAKVDLLETIRRSADLFAEQENVKITVNSTTSDCFISADRQQMLRVFNNLFSNSVQAIGKKEDGRIDIEVSVSGKNYRVAITDNGSGISEEQASRIFSPSFTTKSSGMGLGLAMVKNILSGIGATITFTSEEGAGTTFVLEIPSYE